MAGAALVPLLVGWAVGSTFGVRVLIAKGMRTTVAGAFAIVLVAAATLTLAVWRAGVGPLAMVALAVRIYRDRTPVVAPGAAAGEQRQAHAVCKQMFAFSILYLFLLFAMLLVDKFTGPLVGHIAA